MYNRKLRRRKFRRNATVTDFTGGEPTGFTSIPEARAFLLRHTDLCKVHFDPKTVTPTDVDPSLIRSIENAARLIKKADRRNYRRQTKSAVKKIIKNKKYIPLLSASSGQTVSELDFVRYEELQEALKSLSAAIGKSIEVEANVIKAERKIRNYIGRTHIGGKKIGAIASDGIMRLPDFLEEMVVSLFKTQSKRLAKTPSFEMQMGINRVTSSDESSDIMPPLPRRRPTQMELVEEWGEPEEIEEEQQPHVFELVVGPIGEIITFRINRTQTGRIRSGHSGIVKAKSPNFRQDDVIFSMIKVPEAYIVDSEGDIFLEELGINVRLGELTEEMQRRYENSYLYLIRKYASDGRRKEFLRGFNNIDGKKQKFSKSRKSRKLKKRKK